MLDAIGKDEAGAYRFAWGFGFFQFLFEFGASSALQRQISDAWTRGDRDGVDRAIASGMNFYAVMAIIQVAALLGVAYWALPHSGLQTSSYPLVVKLLWLQAITAPCFGFSVVVSSVLQAARRYDFVPRYELAITVLRFVVLWLGVKAGIDFFWIVATQTAIQIGLALGPALWVMVRELDHVPHFHGARWADYKALGHISFYIALIQISVVLADKVDTTILGFMLPENAGAHIAVYDIVSKAVLAAPPDRLDARLPGDAGRRQPGGRATTHAGWSGSSTTAPGCTSACSCRWGCWPGSMPVPSSRCGVAIA